MPLVKTIRKRGATTTVEANAEVLFLPSGPVGPWLNRLSNAVTRATIAAAPANKRPRWDHYGIPLKKSITSTTQRVGATHLAAVVGSRATYSAYVNEGTGVYAGNSPYEAKILPPYAPGSPTLYERTWSPNPNSGGRAPVMIRGQRGQFFFQDGLARGLASMRIANVEVPEGAVPPNKTRMPLSMLRDVLGNTSANAAFRQQLEEWRSWRDAAWKSNRVRDRSGEGGTVSAARRRAIQYKSRARGRVIYNSEQRLEARRANAKRYRDRVRGGPVKSKKPVRTEKPTRTVKARTGSRVDRNAFFASMQRKYGWADRQSLVSRDGYYYVTVRVRGDRGRYEYREVRAKIKG